MNYIVVSAANNRSFYLAKQRIGGAGYATIATFLNEQMAKDTAALLNQAAAPANSFGEAFVSKVIKGGRR